VPAVPASCSYAVLPGLPGYIVNLSVLTLRTATDSFWRWRPARPGKAAETVSSATLDEQLFDHQRNAPIRSKIM